MCLKNDGIKKRQATHTISVIFSPQNSLNAKKSQLQDLSISNYDRALPDIKSGLEVRQIFKIRTGRKPNVFLPGRWTLLKVEEKNSNAKRPHISDEKQKFFLFDK